MLHVDVNRKLTCNKPRVSHDKRNADVILIKMTLVVQETLLAELKPMPSETTVNAIVVSRSVCSGGGQTRKSVCLFIPMVACVYDVRVIHPSCIFESLVYEKEMGGDDAIPRRTACT